VYAPEAASADVVDRIRLYAFAGAALSLALSLAAAAFLSRRLGRPLRESTERARVLSQRFAGGQIRPRQGEIDSLVASFDAMTSALLTHSERLKQAHAIELQHRMELQRQYAMMRLLRGVAAAGAESTDIEAALRTVLQDISAFFDWPLGRVALLDENVSMPRGVRSRWAVRDEARFAAFIEMSDRGKVTPTVRNLIGRAFLTGAPYWLSDIESLAGWNRLAAARACGLRSAFAIPVMASGHAVAFIELFCDQPMQSGVEIDELLQTIADELSRLAERHLAQKALAVSQALVRRLALVAEHNDKLSLLLDTHGRVVWVNESLLRRRDAVPGRLLGRSAYEALGLAPTDTQAVMKLGDAIVRGAPCRTDLVAASDQGGEIVLDIEGQPLADHNGGYGQYMLMCTDVTEARARAQALIDAKDAAEQANRAKSQFLANMSHEIRTPMNGVLGMTELLLGTALSAKQRRFVEAVYRSGETLLEIINDILDLSKIEAGRLELDRSEFCLRVLIEDVFEMLAPRAHEKRLELACRIDPAVPAVLIGDPMRLRQVFANLVGNAIKFTDEGEVVVTVKCEPLDGPGKRHRLIFEVRDTGIGIAADAQARLFTPFMQADQSMSRRYGGTGLGLTISRQLVEMMGGHIEVRSTPGQGSVFRFDVLLAAGEPAVAALPATQLSGKHALLVEDNPVNRTVLEGHLTAFGMYVASAQQGAHGLELLRAAAAAGRQFDVVVVDQKMPVMDGATMIERLRAEPALRQLPVLMLTSINDTVEPRRAHSGGAQLQLAKPVRRSDLANALALALGQGASRSKTMPDEHRLHGVRVLLAEDNVVNQEVVRAMLADHGCALEVAADGEQALHILRSARFDLVLMDCQMPRMDGFEVVKRLRASDAGDFATGADVAVIALTANALAGDAERCAAGGFSDYLAKPVRRERLLQTLARWVGEAHRRTSQVLPVAAPVTGAAAPEPAQAEETAVVAPESVLDMAAIDRIRQMQRRGAVDLLPRLRAMFTESAATLVASIDAALAAGDGDALRRAAHTLKSASGNLGAAGFSHCCAELESMGHNGKLAEARALWRTARADWARVVSALHALESDIAAA
jgi:signal transduction histidine kinase/CheY-like chemotaxis protein/HPt (histidine-containing phosphotransfer) domain-containing protein